MRRIVLYIAMSLDGYLADPAGGVDWLTGPGSILGGGRRLLGLRPDRGYGDPGAKDLRPDHHPALSQCLAL